VPKHKIGIDVLTAAKQRIKWTFDTFEKIYLSFSAGKDSAVMLHLVMDEAKKRNRKVGCFFIDWECQIGLTIDFAKKMYAEYAENIEPSNHP
jgi:predicted phosphoadenosine phosphosulfate sulfurtransferase